MDDVAWLTVGLMIFAGAQVWVQWRSELARRTERRLAEDEATDRAFHFAWAEHFRLDSLAKRLETSDLVELTILGVLKPEDVLPGDAAKLTEALSAMGREAGFLGGVAGTLAHDTARQIAIYTGSVRSFAAELPESSVQLDSARIDWVHRVHDADIAEWAVSIRKSVRELSDLLWDAASHSPRASVERRLVFSDNMTSRVGKDAVAALSARSVKPTTP